MLIALMLPAFNLRPGITGVGPVLAEINESLSLGPVGAGLLTAMPVLTFGVFALASPTFVSWFGLHRLALISITVTSIGMTVRPWTDNSVVFLTLTSLGLSGIAVLNVILPSLVKRHFADRVGFATAVYTGVMGVGLTLGAFLTQPIAMMFANEGWRFGISVWGITSVICIPVWVIVAIKFPRTKEANAQQSRISMAQVAKTRLGWFMAIFFGLQSLQAYAMFGWFAQLNRDAGFSASTASILLTGLTFASVPAGFIAAWLAGRENLRKPIVLGMTTLYFIAYAGLILLPTMPWIWVWTFVLGIGLGVFPVALAFIGFKAETVAGTAALSAFTQSIGYAIAFFGPFGMGVIHSWTGGWTVPLIVLFVLAIFQFVAGWGLVRQPHLEQALRDAT